ncbi:MAG: hypothetical protein Mars2KO_44310 [Maribacter sp.]
MRKITLIERLKKISSEDSPSFPYDIRKLLSGKITSVKSQILQSSRLIYEDENLDETLRFKAYYLHMVMLWRLKEFESFRLNLDTNFNRFESHKLFNAFRAQYFLSQENTQYNLESAIYYAKLCAKELGKFPSVLHLHALTIVNYAEDIKEHDIKKLRLAESQVNKAIALSKGEYAGHYALSARVKLLLGKFTESYKDLRNAIEKEPSNNNEYPIRIGEYHEIKSRISNAEYIDFVKKQQEKAMTLFSNLRVQMIQLLGILSAVIIFMVSTVQIAQNIENIRKAALLIFIGGLVSVMVFALFSLVFIEGKVKAKSIILSLFCIIAIILAINFL